MSPRLLPDGKAQAIALLPTPLRGGRFSRRRPGWIITQRGNLSEKIFNGVSPRASLGDQEGIAGWLSMRIDKPSVMVVAVDTKNELYGYTQQEIAEKHLLPYVTLIFKPWKEGTEYKDGNWIFRNQFYVPLIYIDSHITAQLQAEEGAEPTVPSNLRVYAYAVDTTAWKINSTTMGAAIITSKSDPKQTRTSPDFEAYYSKESGTYGTKVSSPTLMVVVTDPVNQPLRLFETGGRPRRRARDLPDRLPHMAPGIPLCRGGLARGQ